MTKTTETRMFLSPHSSPSDPPSKMEPSMLDMQQVLRAYAMQGLLPPYMSQAYPYIHPPVPAIGVSGGQQGVAGVMYTTPRTWHPHIYEKSPRQPTPHSIRDILGVVGGERQHPDRQTDKHPDRLTTSPSCSETSAHSADSGLGRERPHLTLHDPHRHPDNQQPHNLSIRHSDSQPQNLSMKARSDTPIDVVADKTDGKLIK